MTKYLNDRCWWLEHFMTDGFRHMVRAACIFRG